ncbi:MAG TPA: carboxypeptidase regulatory-like domain-containing protein, partial [Flavisolibacter sp.]|nr:carboxypeptidase regulatory-like domain-containing protein [Flavisolibacter sp.]
MTGKVLPLVLALLFAQALHAQFSISGTVTDQQAGAPLRGASVRLRSAANATVSQNMLSDSLGRFQFQNLAADSFLLSISFVGYKDVSRGIRLDSASITPDTTGTGGVDINVAMVPSSSQDLATVVITARTPLARQKQDTVEFNASQLKVNPDASAEDLARKVPGITIENGQVKAQGENVQRVTIDGRELFGDDATAALRNLPAEIIDKIQVFDRLSDQAQFTGVDDGNTTKGINIVTKANMRNGQFGRVYAGYGTDQRYLAGGNATILKDNRRISIVGNFNNVNQQNFSQQDLLGVTSNAQRGGGGGGPRGARGGGGGNRGQGGGGNFGGFGNNANFLVGQQAGINRTNALGINFSDVWGKKLTVTGSYFFNNTDNTTNETSNQQYFLGNVPNLTQTNNASSSNNNHRVNMRLEWRLDSSNQIIITPNLSFQTNSTDRVATTNSFFTSGKQVSATTNATTSNRTGNNLSNSILWRHSFAKRGRTFSINLNTSGNQRDGDVYVNSFQRRFDAANNPLDTTTKRYTDQSNSGYQLSANLVYTEPVGKQSQLQFNYNPSYSNSKADQQAYRQNGSDEGYTVFDTTLSNRFNTITKAQNAGMTYRIGNRDNQVSFGANYQYNTITSDQDFPRA